MLLGSSSLARICHLSKNIDKEKMEEGERERGKGDEEGRGGRERGKGEGEGRG